MTTIIHYYNRLKFRVILLFILFPLYTFSQDTSNWFHLDPWKDNVLGISTYRAYDYLKDRRADTVIVAVIDNGADINHEDLKNVIWTNKGEIPGNGIDDDKNGYIDDIHGWNFLGNSKGRNLKRETTELTRTYARLKVEYDKNGGHLPATENELFQQVSKEYLNELNSKKEWLAKLQMRKQEILASYSVTQPSLEKKINELEAEIETRLNPDCRNRQEIVGDDPDNLQDSIYGNNMVDASGPYHGTSVVGIIGAEHNGIGIDGVARHVKLMILRIVPNGDERDKDVALAILYAVRNGASIINCSFAKEYTSHPEFVQKAIKEAESKGVLIVHGAGNEANDNDIHPYYPDGKTGGNEISPNWITVGASEEDFNDRFISWFSNYGKTTVDVFAPGANIRSCALNNKYDSGSGTSISAPIVAGLAAVLKSYFPYLQGAQLKQIILKSVMRLGDKEVILAHHGDTLFKINELCISGGIVNLYYAIKIAEKEYPQTK